MLTSLVLTVIGPDRPGLVNLLSELANTFGANWLESRMASLAGEFAGIVHLHVASDRADALIDALRELDTRGLRVSVTRSRGEAGAVHSHLLRLELVAQDRPGIVRDVSRAIAAQGVSIEQLDSDVFSGAYSGEHMFQAKALLRLPAGVSADQLRDALEDLANEMVVDFHLDDVAASDG